MRIISNILLSTILISCGSSATKNPNAFSGQDTIEINRVIVQQKYDWNKGDIDAYMTGYEHSDTLKFITKRGVRMGYDSICARYKRAYDSKEKMGHLDFEQLRYYPLATEPLLYQVTGNWRISGRDSAAGNFSLLLRKNDKGWKIIVDHTW